jgi:hypothetical protein
MTGESGETPSHTPCSIELSADSSSFAIMIGAFAMSKRSRRGKSLDKSIEGACLENTNQQMEMSLAIRFIK